ncbi:LIM-domain binding protein-domain-containing protein [Trametes meyenii]|nr:LIM-domain binding protein-domain-containing protein [Trametes meyenii]
MNVQQTEMMRQGVPTMHQNIISQPFFPQPQQGQQPTAHNMGPFQNNQGANPTLGLMGGQPGASNHGYPLNMPGAPRRGPPMFMPGPHSTPSSLNPPGGGGPSHMPGLAPGQLPNIPTFPGGAMMGQQQTLRRVQSQPMNQSGAHIPGMQPGMMGGGMGLNGPPNMNPMRQPLTPAQQQQMQLQMRQQAQQQAAQGGAMSQEMALPMNRAHMQGAGQMPPHARTASGQAQLMPGSMSQHGMPQQMSHNAFGNPMSLPHQHQHQQSSLGASPHVGGSGQPQPGMPGTLGGQAAINRAQMTPDNSMFMNFQNQQQIQPPVVHNVPRLPMNSQGFNVNFAGSPTPPNPGGDMAQRGNPTMNAPGPVITPAQALDKMNSGAENFPTGSYGMGQPPINAPPRPPSQHSPHNAFPIPQPQSQPLQPHPPQQSPRQADRIASQMHAQGGVLPRPRSQQSPMPPGPSRTPRVAQTPLPMNTGGMMPPNRIPPGPGQSPQGPTHQQVQPPASAPPSAHPTQIAPRPPSANPPTTVRAAPPQSAPPMAPGPQVPAAAESSAAVQSVHPPLPASVPAPVPAPASAAPPRPPGIIPVGFGQCVSRILQLSGSLGVEHKDRLKQSYWASLVANFFTEKATMKLTLWKDNQQVEAKPFEIGYPILPRFFLVTTQSGVKSMTICIDGARERVIKASHALVECATASWTFRYQNGYSITLRGPLTADVIVQPQPASNSTTATGTAPYVLKLDRLQFDAFWHEKYVALDSILGERIPESPRGLPPSPGPHGQEDTSRFDEARYHIEHAIVPAEPINAFGIPQATMRCLELAESVAQMSELIQFSVDSSLGPVDALGAFADRLRAARRSGQLNGLDGAGPSHHVEGTSAFDGHGINGVNGTPPNMFMHNANNVAGPSQSSSGGDQSQNAAHADGADPKAKGTPQAAQASGSTPAASASTPTSAPTPGGSTTPAMANATLKRKAPTGGRAGDDSPTTATAEQQPTTKRTSRKRGRTQGS